MMLYNELEANEVVMNKNVMVLNNMIWADTSLEDLEGDGIIIYIYINKQLNMWKSPQPSM